MEKMKKDQDEAFAKIDLLSKNFEEGMKQIS
jgi:hypothetical protein